MNTTCYSTRNTRKRNRRELIVQACTLALGAGFVWVILVIF